MSETIIGTVEHADRRRKDLYCWQVELGGRLVLVAAPSLDLAADMAVQILAWKLESEHEVLGLELPTRDSITSCVRLGPLYITPGEVG